MLSGAAKALAVARAAWVEDAARPKSPSRRRSELEFLPAAVEVIETPPSRFGRAMAWLIVAFFVVGIAWAWFGQIDVVAIAQGKVIPTGRSKVVQPMETGVVKAIRVQDGQEVKAGEILIELDTTTTGADRERLAAELAAARVEAARLNAAVAPNPETAFRPPAGVDQVLVEVNRALLASQLAEYRAKLALLDEETARKRADVAAIQANIVKIERTLPLVRERAQGRADLAERGFSSRFGALETQQQLIEQEQDLIMLRHRRDETNAAIASFGQQRSQTDAEFRKTLFVQLSETERKIAGLTQELLKAEQRRGLQTLTAPIDGVVQQVAVHTVGGVVTPAQPLLVVVPKDDSLEIEVMILNRDIGFIAPGQEVAIKLETFQFTKYGTIPGRIASVSRDAMQDPAQQKPALVYPARITLDRATVDVGGRQTTLGAGMAVTAEIKTDRRRVLDYLLSPILRYQQETMRER